MASNVGDEMGKMALNEDSPSHPNEEFTSVNREQESGKTVNNTAWQSKKDEITRRAHMRELYPLPYLAHYTHKENPEQSILMPTYSKTHIILAGNDSIEAGIGFALKDMRRSALGASQLNEWKCCEITPLSMDPVLGTQQLTDFVKICDKHLLAINTRMLFATTDAADNFEVQWLKNPTSVKCPAATGPEVLKLRKDLAYCTMSQSRLKALQSFLTSQLAMMQERKQLVQLFNTMEVCTAPETVNTNMHKTAITGCFTLQPEDDRVLLHFTIWKELDSTRSEPCYQMQDPRGEHSPDNTVSYDNTSFALPWNHQDRHKKAHATLDSLEQYQYLFSKPLDANEIEEQEHLVRKHQGDFEQFHQTNLELLFTALGPSNKEREDFQTLTAPLSKLVNKASIDALTAASLINASISRQSIKQRIIAMQQKITSNANTAMLQRRLKASRRKMKDLEEEKLELGELVSPQTIEQWKDAGFAVPFTDDELKSAWSKAAKQSTDNDDESVSEIFPREVSNHGEENTEITEIDSARAIESEQTEPEQGSQINATSNEETSIKMVAMNQSLELTSDIISPESADTGGWLTPTSKKSRRKQKGRKTNEKPTGSLSASSSRSSPVMSRFSSPQGSRVRPPRELFDGHSTVSAATCATSPPLALDKRNFPDLPISAADPSEWWPAGKKSLVTNSADYVSGVEQYMIDNGYLEKPESKGDQIGSEK